jgi:hypothetical protein
LEPPHLPPLGGLLVLLSLLVTLWLLVGVVVRVNHHQMLVVVVAVRVDIEQEQHL